MKLEDKHTNEGCFSSSKLNSCCSHSSTSTESRPTVRGTRKAEVGEVMENIISEIEGEEFFVGEELQNVDALVQWTIEELTFTQKQASKSNNLAYNYVHRLLSSQFPNLEIDVYGSVSTGLFLNGKSDLDILLNFEKVTQSDCSMLRYYPNIPVPYNEHIQNADLLLKNCYYQSWNKLATHLYIQNNDILYEKIEKREIITILSSVQNLFYARQNSQNVPHQTRSPSMTRETSHAKTLSPMAMADDSVIGDKGRKKRSSYIPASKWSSFSISEEPQNPVLIQEIKLIQSNVPVLKLKLNMNQVVLDVDVSVLTPEHSGLQARDFILSTQRNFPQFKPLCMFLKLLLQKFNFNDTYTGGVGSYALSLLILFMLNVLEAEEQCSSRDDDFYGYSEYLSFDEVKSSSPRRAASFFSDVSCLPFSNSKPTARRIYKPIFNESAQVNYLDDEIHVLENSKKLTLLKKFYKHHKDVSSKNLGLLVMCFFKLFCLPSDGGLELSSVCVDPKKGKLCPVEGGQNLSIKDPVAVNHCIGEGSFEFYKVQGLFSDFAANISKLSACFGEKAQALNKKALTNQKKYDIKGMSQKLEAVQHRRASRLRANYEKFMAGMQQRREIMSCPAYKGVFENVIQRATVRDRVKQQKRGGAGSGPILSINQSSQGLET
eukprot:snap_masked-scaffold_3-processed-gene-3.52-mRNA-1 protein AED:1.00 eAED:1.00 QI:0/-1/0/0/-1/1/1/0/659